MSINTDLNVDPYFDDFDIEKQFVRVLFKPARSVQARELTQLQTMLQSQVERFGSNIYKEGTIITGVSINELQDIFFVKLDDDTSGITGATDGLISFLPYRATELEAESIADVNEDDLRFFSVRGASSGLKAEIISASEGFETRSPDLKTFYIKYTGTTTGANVTLDQFEAGEELEIFDPDGNRVGNITVTTFTNHAGRSFGVTIEDGIVYQKGHFNYVSSQTLIVQKYNSVPDDVSIGFTIVETIVSSNQDQTLLDNAQGYNNLNAPGADRLKLQPLLVSYAENAEPEEFFAIIRYKRGSAIQIRDTTEFNVLNDNLARRTYDESGNYVVNGFNVNTQVINESGVDNQYVTVSPGKAYVRGYEVQTLATRYLPLTNLSNTKTLTQQTVGARYGNYFTTSGFVTKFNLDGTEYNLYDSGNNIIGTASVSNVEDGKIYVYNLRKNDNKLTTAITGIGPSLVEKCTVDPGLNETESAPMIFSFNQSGVTEVDDLSYVRRTFYTASTGSATNTINIPFVGTRTPLNNDNFLVIDGNNAEIAVTSGGIVTDSNSDSFLQLTLASNINPQTSRIYFDERVVPTTQDTKENLSVKVQTAVSTVDNTPGATRASLGVPDAYALDRVWIYNSAGSTPETTYIEDVTNKFKIVSNQKDGMYDYSYIELKTGQTLNMVLNSNLLVSFSCYKHNTNNGAGFFTGSSYSPTDITSTPLYRALNGTTFELSSCVDFRPSVVPLVNYHTGGDSSAPVVSPVGSVYQNSLYAGQAKNIDGTVITSVANVSEITASVEYYMPRKDTVAIDMYGEVKLIQGQPALVPSAPGVIDELNLASVKQISNAVQNSGIYAAKIENRAHPRYTMEQIDGMAKKIDAITEITTLSLLETDTKDLLITDACGLNRFKNGFLVDPMKNLAIADVTSAEHQAAVDTGRERLTPAIREFPVHLKRGDINTDSNNVDYFKDVVTKANTGSESVLNQRFATQFRNCVSNFYLFTGQGAIFPEYDSGVDRIPGPPSNIDIDIATPLLNLVDTLDASGFIDTTSESTTTRASTVISENGFWATDTFVSTATALRNTTSNINQHVGNFITDVKFNRFIESNDVKVFVWGLRPNTLHKFYFAEDDVTANVAKGTMPSPDANGQVDVSDIEILGSFGETISGEIALLSDNTGRISAVFRIPASTYYIGDNALEISDALSYASLLSARTSYAKFIYRAYNLDLTTSALNVTTRTVNFDTQTIQTGVSTRMRRIGGDPIAQTFFTSSEMAAGSGYVLIDSLDIFFRTKDSTQGVTVELREVENGYPTKNVLPFAKVHLDSTRLDANGNTVDVIKTSSDGSVATTVNFPNPVRLALDSEYCFVVMPDGNNPNFNIFTSKVGGLDLASGNVVSQDWGTGVLFTSTNNSAWRSYQDEDIKFRLNRYTFSTLDSHINLIPDNMEFLEIEDINGVFLPNEVAYSTVPTVNITSSITVDSTEEGSNYLKLTTANNNAFPFAANQYVLVEQSTSNSVHLSPIVSINTDGDVMIIKKPLLVGTESGKFDTSSPVEVTLVKGGIVTYYNKFRSDQLHLKKSSASTTNYFEAGDIVIGATSGARCSIAVDGVIDIPLSYFKALFYTANTIKTSIDYQLFDGVLPDKAFSDDRTEYMQESPRVIRSQSNVVNIATGTSQDFITKVTLNSVDDNVSPIFDSAISLINAYQYTLANFGNSTYVSKEVKLDDKIPAEGLTVFATLHRPKGTDVKIYGRFKYRNNEEEFSEWIELTNLNTSVFSSLATTEDYREFEYELPSTSEADYISFQIKIELESTGIHLAPYVKDYRAVAVS